jgi:hypothetical protein
MKKLLCMEFDNNSYLVAEFVNTNNIPKEDIVSISVTSNIGSKDPDFKETFYLYYWGVK